MSNTHKGQNVDYRYNFLTLRGIKQAELAGMELNDLKVNIDEVHTSTMDRARQTANIVLQAMSIHDSATCSPHKDLDEWWEGHKTPLIGYKTAMMNFVNRVLYPHWLSDKTVMIVGHGNSFTCLFEAIEIVQGVKGEFSEDILRRHVPNSMPFIYDTKTHKEFKYIIPGEHNIFYAKK